MSRRRPPPELEGSDATDERPAFVPESALDEAPPTAREPGPEPELDVPGDTTADGVPMPDPAASLSEDLVLHAPPSWADDATVSLQANELASDLLDGDDDFEPAGDATMVELAADQRAVAAELLGPAGTADLPSDPSPPAASAEAVDEEPGLSDDVVAEFEDELDAPEAPPKRGDRTVPMRPPPTPLELAPEAAPRAEPLDAVAFRRSSTPVPQAPSLSLPERAAGRPLYEVPASAPHASAARYAPTSARRGRRGGAWLWALGIAAVFAIALGYVALLS